MAEILNYKRFGQGKAIIFLHGYALDHSIWLPVAEKMKSKVETILPDMRGHGLSPVPEGKYLMPEMAEDILKLMDKLLINQAVLVGHSMGGYIALAFAKTYPERLSGLALVASHTYADSPEQRADRLSDVKILANTSPNVILQEMPGKLSRNVEIAGHCRQLITKMSPIGMMGVLIGMAERPEANETLADLEVPVVIITGQDDQFIPIEMSRKMAIQMKVPRLVEIHDAGHLLMMENPDLTSKILFELIAQT